MDRRPGHGPQSALGMVLIAQRSINADGFGNYKCAQIKLTVPRDGCSLWEMPLNISAGDSHDQEQDSEQTPVNPNILRMLRIFAQRRERLDDFIHAWLERGYGERLLEKRKRGGVLAHRLIVFDPSPLGIPRNLFPCNPSVDTPPNKPITLP